MTFNGLKQIVFQAIMRQKFDNEDANKKTVNQILTGVLLFKTLQQLIASSSKYQDDIKPTANEYALTFKNISQSLEGKYISYKQIYQKIISYKLTSFLVMTDKQINEIYALYENKTELKEFSLDNFATSMYNLGDIPDRYADRLSRVHFKVIVPIINYYMVYHGIKLRDVKTEDVGNIPSHQIKISINNILNNQLYNDITRDVMGVLKYVASCNMTSDSSVLLIIK